MIRDHFMPWWLYRNSRVAAGVPLETCRADFTSAVLSGSCMAVWEAGEWCVCMFEGVIRDRYKDDSQTYSEHKRRTITDPAELENLRAVGDRMVADFASHLPTPLAQGSLDAPICDATVAEQPMMAAMPGTFRKQLNREVR